jgi:hypothetical protein
MSKKSILFVESINEENKASIIRTISQSLIAVNKNTVYNYVELGYSEYITSILQIDHLKVGVTCQKFTDQETYQIILDLNAKECDVIICVIQRKLENLIAVETFAKNNNYSIRFIKSDWSNDLKISYLNNDTIAEIIAVINRISEKV